MSGRGGRLAARGRGRGRGRSRSAEHRQLPDIGNATNITYTQSGELICVSYSCADVAQPRLRFRSKSGDITPAEQARRKLAEKLGVVLFFSEETVAAAAPTTQDDTTGRARDPSGGTPVRNVRANTAPESGAYAADARAAPPEHGQGDGADAARGVGAMDDDADAARGVDAMDGDAMDLQSTAHTSRTRTAPAPLDPSAGWSEYDRGRVGERHVATREVSYEELFALHDDLDFYREAYSQLRSIVDLLTDPATIECAVVLATTLSECLDEDLQDDDNDDDTAEPADADAATGHIGGKRFYS